MAVVKVTAELMQSVVTLDEIFTVGVTGWVTSIFTILVAVVGEAHWASEVSVQLTVQAAVIFEIGY
jgi:hypothetical protein